MFHLVDAYAMYSITLAGGAHAFVAGAPAFSAAAVLDAIATERVTVSNVASSMISMLLTEHSASARDLSSLELLSCGGSPLAPALVATALATFGCEFFLSYGMTECCGKISMSLLDQPAVRNLVPFKQLELVCTSGRPFRPLQVRHVPADGGAPLSVSRTSHAVIAAEPSSSGGFQRRSS
jgi:acyl-coenzyme A synthetase/AMP-(fatty) acid ligase